MYKRYREICKELWGCNAMCSIDNVETEFGTYKTQFDKGNLHILVVLTPESADGDGGIAIFCWNHKTLDDFEMNVSNYDTCNKAIRTLSFMLSLCV